MAMTPIPQRALLVYQCISDWEETNNLSTFTELYDHPLIMLMWLEVYRELQLNPPPNIITDPRGWDGWLIEIFVDYATLFNVPGNVQSYKATSNKNAIIDLVEAGFPIINQYGFSGRWYVAKINSLLESE